jgi:DNA-binding IscR family transcriptional regulator
LTAGRPPGSIVIGDVMDLLGGRLFESDFCDSHSGQAAICTRSVDCPVRSLWRAVQVGVDQVLSKATLRGLLQNEEEMNSCHPWLREKRFPTGHTRSEKTGRWPGNGVVFPV